VRRLAPIGIVAALALVAAGCGGSGASGVASQTSQNLAKIRSGILDLRLIVTPKGSGRPFGFELKGPFSLRPGKLPLARVAYTQIANGHSATATLVSDGTHAWAVSGGSTAPLSAAQTALLMAAAPSGKSGGILGFDVGKWVQHPSLSDGGAVGGAPTDEIRGGLDVVAAANDLLALTGRATRPITGDDAKRLQQATRSSSVDLFTGKKDRLLRRLTLSADLGFDVPPQLRAALGNIVGAKVQFLLAVTNPNGHVTVKAP
jgi:hypothetical protein